MSDDPFTASTLTALGYTPPAGWDASMCWVQVKCNVNSSSYELPGLNGWKAFSVGGSDVTNLLEVYVDPFITTPLRTVTPTGSERITTILCSDFRQNGAPFVFASSSSSSSFTPFASFTCSDPRGGPTVSVLALGDNGQAKFDYPIILPSFDSPPYFLENRSMYFETCNGQDYIRVKTNAGVWKRVQLIAI
jgi:hypothetical protein